MYIVIIMVILNCGIVIAICYYSILNIIIYIVLRCLP